MGFDYVYADLRTGRSDAAAHRDGADGAGAPHRRREYFLSINFTSNKFTAQMIQAGLVSACAGGGSSRC
jgi:hypothetical protein